MGTFLRKWATVLATMCVAACASTQPRFYYDAYGENEAGERVYSQMLANELRSRADDARTSPADPAKAGLLLEAGMALTDLLCLDYFNRATGNRQHRGFAKTVLNDTNGLVSAIMGLTNAGSLATGAVGASFSFANSTAGNVENNYGVVAKSVRASQVGVDADGNLTFSARPVGDGGSNRGGR